MARFDDAEVTAILQGRRAVTATAVGLPGADLRVGVRCLSDQDLDDARLEAQRYVEGRAKRAGLELRVAVEVDPETLDRAIEREIVFRAFVDPDEHDKPFFPSPAAVRTLDSVAVRALLNVYLDHQERISPRATLTDEEVRELVGALGKEPAAPAILAHFDPATLRSCVRSLASALRSSSPTGSSSTGPSSPVTS